MKYSYKKQMKKLLMLFLFLPAALAAVAQVPGTPYGVTALTCAAAPATPGTITLSATTVNLNGTFTASITAVSGATSYVWTLPTGLTGTSTTNSITITGATAGTYAVGTIKVAAKNDCGTSATSNSTAAVSVVINPGSLPDGSGSFAGRTCFDVAQENSGECGDLTSRQNETLTANGSLADFSNTITRNQTYTFTPSGTVSNVRFLYVESGTYTGQIIQSISGGNSGNNISTAVSCNIVYKSDLNSKASGKTNSTALTVDIYAVYNDNAAGTGDDKKLQLTASIKDCACCGAFTTGGTWLSFMCYNLGADASLTTPDQIKNAATSQTYGYFYQWGKTKTWPSSGSISGWSSSNNTAVNGAGGNLNDDAWGNSGAKTSADPCPAGWRVPTQAQWGSIFRGGTTEGAPGTATANTWTWNGSTTTHGYQIGHSLFLPAAGNRDHENGALNYPGSYGNYWSRRPNDDFSYSLFFNSSRVYPGGRSPRSAGFQVRCVVE
jgi:uncharacterized protein (TIGR02145 family)